MKTMKTFFLKEREIQRKVHLVDAQGKILGRLATQVALILMGKHRPEYTPFLDCGDQVIVINAAQIRVTGKKTEQKTYSRYTGYPGGLRLKTLKVLLEEKPEEVVYEAIRKMLPHTKLGDKMIRHLRVYAGPEHEQAAQKPLLLEIKS